MSDLPHLRLTESPNSLRYTYRGGGGSTTFALPPRDRTAHADHLRNQLAAADATAAQLGLPSTEARYLTYDLRPTAAPVIDSLERSRSGIVILSVQKRLDFIRVVVRVPAGKQRIIAAILKRYATEENPSNGKPKHQRLVDSIDDIRLASQADLWTDNSPFPSDEQTIWWEVWLYHGSGEAESVHSVFRARAITVGLAVQDRFLAFPDRVVVLVRGSYRQWAEDPTLLLLVAELRSAKQLASEYTSLAPREQRELVAEAASRIVPPPTDAPAVCLLDTGVVRSHPLIEPALAEEDCHAVDPGWSLNDDHPHKHGTAMAGVALFPDLAEFLSSSQYSQLGHRLESVKIVSFSAANDPELYGSIVAEALARVEVVHPSRRRAFCLTVTADSRDQHLPSSWSAALDQVCAGGEASGVPKLVCVSAGNLRDQLAAPGFAYPLLSGRDAGIEDPGQAWNALTVGAMTYLDAIVDNDLADYEPIARAGDLSPSSRTSLAWDENGQKGWPLKPDVVMEGGNWAVTPNGSMDTPDDLGLLTTTADSSGRLLTVTRDTSPATAAVTRIAAEILHEYSELWPETVRGLIVHSAKWTSAMLDRFPGCQKSVVQRRLRCYGYGVPSASRAIYSARNAATLLYEGSIRPYRLDGGKVKSNEMHVHELPWPVSLLQDLGALRVRLRITLSYFIEPSPGRRGWTNRHRYASHGLRFDLKRPTESQEDFLARLSAEFASDEDDASSAASTPAGWLVGAQGRTRGSIHRDQWEGTAADLAAMSQLAIFPVTGWWRERRQLNRWNSLARYSLIVSLETDRTDLDIYSAIANTVEVVAPVSANA